jgi:hypothetical protein
MSTKHTSECVCDAPSTPELIRALDEHNDLFQFIATHPQADIYERFGPEYASAVAYVESEVHRHALVAKTYILEKSRVASKEELSGPYRNVMGDLVNSLLLLGGCFYHGVCGKRLTEDTDRVHKASHDMTIAPPPTMRAMDEYRLVSGCNDGNHRAANGEKKLMYGKEGMPVPSHLATRYNEDLDSITQFMADCLMDPFLDYVSKPFRSVLSILPLVGKRFKNPGSSIKFVRTSTISAIANASVYMTVIIFLSGGIAILDYLKNTKLRILAIMLFAQVFAISVRFVGPHSIPMCMLITA